MEESPLRSPARSRRRGQTRGQRTNKEESPHSGIITDVNLRTPWKAHTLLIRLAMVAVSLVLLAGADSGMDVTYIANEGFLIAGGGHKV